MNSEISVVLERPAPAANFDAVIDKRARAPRTLIVATTLLVLFFALPILSFPPGRDQGTYLQIGQSLLQGKHLYVDLWDNKPPGIFYIYAGIARIFGRVMWSVAVVDLLVLLVTSFLLFQFVERYLGSLGAAIAVVVHAGWHAKILYFWITQPENFQIPCMLGACLLLMSRGKWRTRSFAAGLLFGVGFWLKYNFVAFLPLVLFLPFLDESALDRRSPRFALRITWREWLLRTAFLASGFLLTVVVVMTWIVHTGGWPAMREAQFQVLPRYATMAITDNPIYPLMAVARTYFCLRPSTCFATLAVLVWGWFSRDFKRLIPIFLAAAVSLAATVIQVRFHSYYFQICFPFFAAIWAYLALKLYEGTVALAAVLKAKQQKVAAVLVWIVFANLVFWPLPEEATQSLVNYEEFRQWRSDRDAFYANYPNQLSIELLNGQLSVVRYIRKNTKPNDNIYLWGSNSLIYFLTGRQSPTRFVLNLGVVAKWGEPSWKDEVARSVEAANPRLIIVTKRDALPSITYVYLDSEQYLRQEFSQLDNYIRRYYTKAEEFDGFVVYKRN